MHPGALSASPVGGAVLPSALSPGGAISTGGAAATGPPADLVDWNDEPNNACW